MREVIALMLLSTALGCGPEFQSNGEGGMGGSAGTGGSDGQAGGDGKSMSDTCPITACGGDVVGTWQISSVCTDWRVDPATTGTCPTASSINNAQMNGTYTYGADGAFSWDTRTGGTTTVTLPAECITDLTSCAQLAAEFTPENGYISGSCTGNPSTSCTCTGKLTEEPSKGAGKYELDGNVLRAILGSDTSSSSYCAKGNKLTTQYAASNVVTTLVATKL
jgi:hypothetical protein